MELEKKFNDNLEHLKRCKQSAVLQDFFEAIDTLMHPEEVQQRSSRLRYNEQEILDKLEVAKEEIAMRTKTQKEFDAVYECIDYLTNHYKTIHKN